MQKSHPVLCFQMNMLVNDLKNESIVPIPYMRKVLQEDCVAVMVSTKPDFNYIKSNLAGHKALDFFLSSLLISSQKIKTICVAGPFIGAAYSTMILESLIASKIKKIILLGWCGTISNKLKIGDIVLVKKAFIDEGTSSNYKKIDQDFPFSKPSLNLSFKLSEYLNSCETKFKKSLIWTTDAIYRETENKKKFYEKLGADAVDMECSALFSVAEYRKVEISALLIVSDNLDSKEWKKGHKKQIFQEARKDACKVVMSFANIIK